VALVVELVDQGVGIDDQRRCAVSVGDRRISR
jgi:hypothetical protein